MTTIIYAEKNGHGVLACDSQVTAHTAPYNFPVNKAVEVNVNGYAVVLSCGELRFINAWKALAEVFADTVAEYRGRGKLENLDKIEDFHYIQSCEDDFLGYVKNNTSEALKFFNNDQGIALFEPMPQEGGSRGIPGSFLIASEKYGGYFFGSSLAHSRVTKYVALGSGGESAEAVLTFLWDQINTKDELISAVVSALDTSSKQDSNTGGDRRLYAFEIDEENVPSIKDSNVVSVKPEAEEFYRQKMLLESEEEYEYQGEEQETNC